MELVLAHGGTGGLLVETVPVVAIAALWFWVWRKSKREEAAASGAAGTDDEPPVEEGRG